MVCTLDVRCGDTLGLAGGPSRKECSDSCGLVCRFRSLKRSGRFRCRLPPIFDSAERLFEGILAFVSATTATLEKPRKQMMLLARDSVNFREFSSDLSLVAITAIPNFLHSDGLAVCTFNDNLLPSFIRHYASSKKWLTLFPSLHLTGWLPVLQMRVSSSFDLSNGRTHQ